MKKKSFLMFNLMLMFSLITGMASSPAMAGEDPINQTQDAPVSPACALLDDPQTRGMMSGALETRLMIECGLVPTQAETLARGELVLAPLADDVLVNNPTTDIGSSTTQSETSLAVNPDTGTICSAYNDSQHWAVGSIAFMGFSSSTDGGETFADHGPFPSGGGGNGFGDPSLVWRQSDGNFYYAALHTGGLGLWGSTDDCQSFAYVGLIHAGTNDDKELMAVDNNPTSPYYGRLYVAWTDFTNGHIYSTHSNNTTTWSAPVDISLKSNVQGAWPAVNPVTNDVYVGWVHWDSYPDGPIDIEIVRSTNGGGSFNPVTNPLNNAINPRDSTATTNCSRPALKANTGDGLRYLPSPQISVGPDGVLHVIYVKDPDGYNIGDVINVYYRRSTNNGTSWGPEVLLNDDGTNTDQFFPSLSVGPTNVVAASWYDRRNDTSNNYLFDRYKAFSYDGGLTWSANLRVTDVSSAIPQLKPNFDPIVATCYHGDYDQQVQVGAYLYTQWSDDRNIQNSHYDPDIFFEKEIALDQVGTLTGMVTDAGTSAPVPGAVVEADGLIDFSAVTDINGVYTMTVAAGSYDVTTSALIYQPETVVGVTVTDGGTTVQDFSLNQVPNIVTVSGYVYDANTGWPLYASLEIAGVPLPFWSNPATGYYEIQVPAGGTFDFHVNAWVPGYTPANLTLGPLTVNTVHDYPLDVDQAACSAPGYSFKPVFQDDFEGGFGKWAMTGLWNPEAQADACGSLVAPFPSPSNAAYYGQDGVCDYSTGAATTGSLTLNNPVLLSSDNLTLNISSYEETECGGNCSFDNRYVEISTNGGGTWTTLGEGNSEGAWYQRTFDLSTYTGQNANFRFRFDSSDGIANSYFGWMVDDVTIGSCTPPASGSLVVGNVYDNNTNLGLNGANVFDNDGYSTTSVDTPLDPAVADGFYTLFTPAASPPFAPTASVEIPASDGNFPSGLYKPSFGPAPSDGVQVAAPEQSLAPVPMRSSAYSYEEVNEYLTLFDLSVPEVLPNLNTYSMTDFPGAGETLDGYTYIITGTTTAKLMKFDQFGDFVSAIPVTPPPGSHTYTGMAVDPTDGTVYVSSCDITTSILYTFDLNTGTATQIGGITGSPCTIAIAVDGTGTIYGHDIVNDVLISINKATGAGIVIGSLGFDANFGQGMDWDPRTDTLYLAAFNNGAFRAELRVADRSTGATALVGPIGSGAPGGLTQLPFLGVMEDYHKVLTAEKFIYFPDVEVVDIPNFTTVGQDFYLESGMLSAAPSPLTATVVHGYDKSVLLDLGNMGTLPLEFNITEQEVGVLPFIDQVDAESITWQYKDKKGVPFSGMTDSGETMAYPGAYRYEPAQANTSANILVYTDDWIHVAPNTLVQQALAILGYPATVHVDGDYPGFLNSLNTGGPWDVVIWSGENYGISTYPTLLPDLLAYVQGGGKLVATYWRQLDLPADPLWTEMGFSYISNYVAPPPASWWRADHPLFNIPRLAPEWLNRVQNSGTSQGSRLEPLTNGIAMAGYTTTPSPNESGIILRADDATLYKGIRDVSTNADDDGDYVLDGTELWVDILYGMVNGFGSDLPWLSEDPITGTLAAGGFQVIDVNFDASVPEVTGPGTYEGVLSIINDTPYGALNVPVTMNVIPVQHGVDAALQQVAQSGKPGTTLTYTVVVTNTSNVPDTFDINISGNAWTTTAPPTIGPLGPGVSTTVDIDVIIPSGAPDGITDTATITFTSQGDPTKNDQVVAMSTVVYPKIFLPVIIR